MTTRRLFGNACRGRRLSWEGPRLFLSGAGGPLPDFSFATLPGGGRTSLYEHGRLFIGNSARVYDKSALSRKLTPSAAPPSPSFEMIGIAMRAIQRRAEIDDDLTSDRRPVRFKANDGPDRQISKSALLSSNCARFYFVLVSHIPRCGIPFITSFITHYVIELS